MSTSHFSKSKPGFKEIAKKMISDKEFIVKKIREGKKHELKDKFKFVKGL